MQSVGVIRQLGRYPVKSMRGESLLATMLTLQGVPADRRYAFVQMASRSSFPWFTARELPELLCYSTSVEEAGPQEVEVSVTTPDGEKFPIRSDELRRALEERSGKELFLLYDYRGSYDVAPISLISRQTISQIAKESETEEDPLRFRPNLFVDLEGGEAFDELNWVGRDSSCWRRCADRDHASRPALHDDHSRSGERKAEPRSSSLRCPAAQTVRGGLCDGSYRRGSADR